MSGNIFEKSIRLPYRALPGTKGREIWPIINASLSYKRKKFPQPIAALVDSGADVSTMDMLVAEILGFDLKKMEISGTGAGAGGSYRYWQLPEIDTFIEGHGYKFPFIVIDNSKNLWPCILGQRSIFRVAKITFESFKGQFDISFRADIN